MQGGIVEKDISKYMGKFKQILMYEIMIIIVTNNLWGYKWA